MLARGLVIADIVRDATTKFADGYLRQPKVSMEIGTFRPFYILDEVSVPGDYPYVVGLTAMNTIATARASPHAPIAT